MSIANLAATQTFAPGSKHPHTATAVESVGLMALKEQ